jgi:hypothetical protein
MSGPAAGQPTWTLNGTRPAYEGSQDGYLWVDGRLWQCVVSGVGDALVGSVVVVELLVLGQGVE